MRLNGFPKAFEAQGWQADLTWDMMGDRGDFSRQTGDCRLGCSFSVAKLPDKIALSALVSRSSVMLDDMVLKVWTSGRQARVPLGVKSFMRFAGLTQGDYILGIQGLLHDIGGWVQSETSAEILKRAETDRPDKHATKQLLHIMALVAKGDWMTLSDYKDAFAKGLTLNFVKEGPEPVTLKILENAYSLAIDNAFPT